MNTDLISFTEVLKNITPISALVHPNILYKHKEGILDELKKIIEGEKLIEIQGKTLKIGIVGQVKAGKSSFLNALLFEGENLLPKASTPMTAGLTVIGYADKPYFKVDFYSNGEWEQFEDEAAIYRKEFDKIKRSNPTYTEQDLEHAIKDLNLPDSVYSAKELVDRCGKEAKSKINNDSFTEEFDSTRKLKGKLIDYVGADGIFTSVTKSLFLYLNDDRLKDLEIVDTPGVNDPIVSREERTKEFLRSCHGVFLLSYAGQFCSATDMEFLENRINSQGIGNVVLLASKYDSALQEIAAKFPDDIESADRQLQRDLKKSLEEAIKNVDYKNTKPLFDVTSGLCFSLFKKDEKNWDEVESHVYSRLKKIFPSNFKNNLEAKESLYALSNIEPIRKKYLEKEFTQNKERIITEKSEKYFQSNVNKIKEAIELGLKNISREKNILLESNFTNIKEDGQEMIHSFENLKDDFKDFFNNKKNDLKTQSRQFNNGISWSIVNLKTEPVAYKVKLDKWWLISDSIINGTFQQVNLLKLKATLKAEGEAHIQSCISDWELIFSKKGKFGKELEDFCFIKIKEVSSKDSKIDPNKLTKIIENALSTIGYLSGIDNAEIKDKLNNAKEYIWNEKRFTPKTHRSSKNQITEATIRQEINDSVTDETSKITIATENLSTAIDNDLKGVIKKSEQIIEKELSKMANEFSSLLTIESNKISEQLEKDFGEKNKILSIYDKYILTCEDTLKFLK